MAQELVRTPRYAFTVLSVDGRHAELQLSTFDAQGLRDRKEQRVELWPEGLDAAAANELLAAWKRALPKMLARCADDLDAMMPSDFVFPEAAALKTAAAIEAELTRPTELTRRWHDDRERDELVHAVKNSPHADGLKRLVQPYFHGSSKRGSAAPGASKLGGHPDLPLGTAWPTEADGHRMDFLAQVNLADVSDPRLPPRGVLSFFFGFTEGRVLFHERALERANTPSPLAERTLELTKAWALPPHESPHYPALLGAAGYHEGYALAADTFRDVFTAGVFFDPPHHQLLGYARPLQSSPYVSVEAAAAGETPQQWGQTADFWRRAASWQLLFQVDSEPDAWLGDAGLVYFLIRPDDLAARRFDRARAELQCH